jgi:hypothetical protein
MEILLSGSPKVILRLSASIILLNVDTTIEDSVPED